MKKTFTVAGLICLCLAVFLIVTIQPGRTELAGSPAAPASNLLRPRLLPGRAPQNPLDSSGLSMECALQPDPNPPQVVSRAVPPLPLSRFRQTALATQPISNRGLGRTANYTPKEEIELADLTNFGDRYLRDIHGRSAVHDPIVVLHETVGSAQSAVNLFQTPHPRDEDQSSYHTLIRADGTLIYLVPPDKRAFGAGDSVFKGAKGVETVQTKPDFPPSVNNFAYHISLETPADGDNNNTSHSGYTAAQYQSLAWLVAKTGVPDDRITTHQIVDQSGQRMDPRSFNTQTFLNLLSAYPRTREISIGCLAPGVPTSGITN